MGRASLVISLAMSINLCRRVKQESWNTVIDFIQSNQNSFHQPQREKSGLLGLRKWDPGTGHRKMWVCEVTISNIINQAGLIYVVGKLLLFPAALCFILEVKYDFICYFYVWLKGFCRLQMHKRSPILHVSHKTQWITPVQVLWTYAVRGRLFLISKNCVPVWLYLQVVVKVLK